MRQLAVLAAVVAVALANPRERRQAGAASGYPTCRGGAGVCIPYYLCEDDTIITDGAGIIDIRLGPDPASAQGGVVQECASFLDVCCTNPNINPVTPKPTPGPYQSSCGRRHTQGIDVRIQGFKGNETQVAEFPWMTAILKKEVVSGEELNLYVCGGSLIHPSIVLTTAHCVAQHNAHSLRVRLGEWDTQNEYEPYLHQDRDVQTVVLHPGFNPRNLHNDYALLYLQRPAELSKNVDVICLDNNPSILSPNHNCVVTGWGKDRFGKEGIFQNVLKKVDLPFYDFKQCERALRTTRLGGFFQLHRSFLCAGGIPGQDSCSGDGGSPLVCQDHRKQQYVQIGMVAWGIGCGSEIPGVYADVVGGYNWIVQEADNLLLGDQVTNYWDYV